MSTIKSFFKKPETTKIIKPERQMVVATYNIEHFFKVPKGIDLENKKQVKSYWVKYNTLHIEMVNDEIVDIETVSDESQLKYPDDLKIEPYDDHFDDTESDDECEKPKFFKDTCDMCGKKDDTVGLATGENGEECWVCENCDVDGYNYNGWGESGNEQVCCDACGDSFNQERILGCCNGCDKYENLCNDCGTLDFETSEVSCIECQK